MKRILALPKVASGIIDVRNFDYHILERVSTLEEIAIELSKKNRNPKLFKFCQFEEREEIPFIINIKDKLTNGYSEFEISRVKFKTLDIPDAEKQKALEQRHLAPLQGKLMDIKNDILNLMISEWRGVEISEPQKKQAIKELDDINNKIEQFDYKKYINEIV